MKVTTGNSRNFLSLFGGVPIFALATNVKLSINKTEILVDVLFHMKDSWKYSNAYNIKNIKQTCK